MEKLKKAAPYLLIVLFVGWFSFKFFVERKTTPEPKMTLDWDQLDATSGSATEVVPATIKTGANAKVKDRAEGEVRDEDDFQVFDQIEKEWLLITKGIIDEDHYGAYLEMREKNEKEKAMAYKEYHDYLKQKYGDKFSYNISEDQSVREKEINQRYLKELLALIGNEKFQQYILARDKINEENRRNNKEFIQIEF
ncbi:MAG: hypothetical protein K2Q18_17015 [Bdellovibrionales bacterium]|nr:hypothetical protein [Bdellovibrionales bacterium]